MASAYVRQHEDDPPVYQTIVGPASPPSLGVLLAASGAATCVPQGLVARLRGVNAASSPGPPKMASFPKTDGDIPKQKAAP